MSTLDDVIQRADPMRSGARALQGATAEELWARITGEYHAGKGESARNPRRRHRARMLTAVGLATALVLAISISLALAPRNSFPKVSTELLAAPVLTISRHLSPTTPPGLAAALSELPTVSQEAARLEAKRVSVQIGSLRIPATFLALFVITTEDSAIMRAWVKSKLFNKTLGWLGQPSGVVAIGGGAVHGPSATRQTTLGTTTTSQPPDEAAAKALGASVVRRATSTFVPDAIAQQVVHVMLLQAARSAGVTVSLSAARKVAMRGEKAYEAGVAAGQLGPLPNGESAHQAFDSANAIRGYRNLMILQIEQNTVAGPEYAPQKRRHRELAEWMANHIASAGIEIHGLPAVTVTTLPSIFRHDGTAL